jgi:molybdenum cofactor cytidylyltransferase
MGGDKLTLPYGGSTIVGSVIDSLRAAHVSGITVVLGFHAQRVREALREHEVEFTVNPAPEAGMLSSVKCGIRSLPLHADSFVLALGDQPSLSPGTVFSLERAAKSSARSMFIPESAGKRGHPVLIKSAARESILALPFDVGLNAWRDSNPNEVELVRVETKSVLHDVDTPEEYQAALDRIRFNS